MLLMCDFTMGAPRTLLTLLIWLQGLILALHSVSLPANAARVETIISAGNTGHSVQAPVTVRVNLQQSLNTITDRFVGINLWHTYGFRSPKVRTLARALSPSFCRFGGTGADLMTYSLNDSSADTEPDPWHNMTAGQWEALNEFTQAVGWNFIFDLNALKRNADGSWNPDNARQLLQFSAARNYSIAGFQLGNEYDMYNRSRVVQGSVTPTQLARDVVRLRGLLAEFPQYYSSFITGPETAFLIPFYFNGFFWRQGAPRLYERLPFHHYYFMGTNGSLSYFTDINVMDSLLQHLDNAFAQTRAVNPLLPVWLTETGSASVGGVPGMSDRFVAGFLWLDKLGLCAARGVQVVLRELFYGTDRQFFCLLDNELNPNPDYWLTVLYKRVVRGAVFNTTARHDVRVYAACANTDKFPAGSVVIYTLNPNNYTVTFELPQFLQQPVLLYSLTAGDSDGLVSKYTSLNGVKLELVNDELPPLNPVSAPPGEVTAAPFSYTFIVFPEGRVSLCTEKH